MKFLARIERSFAPAGRGMGQRVAMGAIALAISTLCHAASGGANLSAADKQFLIEAAQAGNAEVMASKLVRTKNTSQEVRSFASQMLSDHTRMADQLKKLATAKGVDLPSDATTSSREQQKITQLSTLDGKEFDRKFTEEIGVNAHRDAVTLFDKASKNAKDRDIERFASANLPALKHHLQMAEEFSRQVSMK